MGLFDYVDINYDLPMPESATEQHVVFIKNAIAADNFQTKDLNCDLSVFYIDKDGYFYEQAGDEYKETYIHQHVECYTSIKIPSENISYWLEYDIKFTDSKIQETSVKQWYPLIKQNKIDLDFN